MTGRAIAIRAEGLAKEFRVYARPVDRLMEAMGARRRHAVVHALKPMDLVVHAGETIGIVGRNGSGKSTLLQLVAGTLQPSAGRVHVQGRVAALLELGSGFSPEFSGRENVFLNGQVLGLDRREVEARFDRIAAFADIGDFIERPVRTYSSGMLVRLAFAVAINTDPDVLIIDEALAVGDEAFQRKCFARIESIKEAGGTILFVSHAAASVVQLCDRAVLLDDGERLLTGSPKDVVGRYQRLVHSLPAERPALREEILAQDAAGIASSPGVAPSARSGGQEPRDGLVGAPISPWPLEASERLDPGLAPESTLSYPPAGARIDQARLCNAQGETVNVLLPGRPYRLRYRVRFESDARDVEFNMTLRTVDGVALYGMSSHGRGGFLPAVAAGDCAEVEFAFESKLLPGTYFLNVGCQAIPPGGDARVFLHRILDVTCFRIEAGTSDRYKIGFYDLAVEPAALWRLGPAGHEGPPAENPSDASPAPDP